MRELLDEEIVKGKVFESQKSLSAEEFDKAKVEIVIKTVEGIPDVSVVADAFCGIALTKEGNGIVRIEMLLQGKIQEFLPACVRGTDQLNQVLVEKAKERLREIFGL
jgi:hypothetical protein